jgi:4-aminobutyrate aminotransferase
MSSASDLQRRREAAVPRGVANAFDIYAARALGAELWDAEGRRYLDFAGGISVVNTGHRHPRVMAAVEAQLHRLWHACFQVTPYEGYVAVAERLSALAPGQAPKKTILFSTGAEAVENALKIARHYTGRPAAIAFAGGFHGRTLATLSLTGKVQPYKSGFGPTLPDVFHVPFPMRYHGITPQDSLAALEQLFKHSVDPARVAALIIEPVLGEGGFYVAGSEFLRALRALCDRHGIVLILDEIQSGCARTGRFFAHEHAGIEADLITVAKSIASGLPLSAVIGKTPIMDAPPPGGLGGTFAGSPLACAAALAVLDVIRDEHLAAGAQRIGAQIEARLLALQADHRAIGEVRGLGAMLAFELVRNGRADEPDADAARAVVQAAARHGLLVLTCGYYGNGVRLLPPLTLGDAQLLEGMDLLAAAVAEVCAPATATAS